MKRKQILWALGAIIIAVGLVIVAPYVFNTRTVTADNSNAAQAIVQAAKSKVTISNGDDAKSYEMVPVAGSTALDFTKAVAEKERITLSIKSYSFGDMIEGINGVASDGEKYWSFYANGELSSVGASQYIVKAGDVIEWRFQKL